MPREHASLDAAEETVIIPAAAAKVSAGGFHIEGTFGATLSFEAKHPDATTWMTFEMTDASDGTTATSTTTTGQFRGVLDGLDVRVRVSSYSSGTAEVYPFTLEG